MPASWPPTVLASPSLTGLSILEAEMEAEKAEMLSGLVPPASSGVPCSISSFFYHLMRVVEFLYFCFFLVRTEFRTSQVAVCWQAPVYLFTLQQEQRRQN